MSDRPRLFPPEFGEVVQIRCQANVGGDTVVVQQEVVAAAYDSSADFREMVHTGIRQALMNKILEKWKPVVQVNR